MAKILDRSANERLKRFKERTGLSFDKLGLMFGVEGTTVSHWYHELAHMPIDCQRTLFRFECENIDTLAKVRPSTARIFREGYKRGRVRA